MMNFQRETLDNGLEIITETNEHAFTTSLGFFVRSGARDETDEVAGVSHFLEHMVFKGTESRNAIDVNRELDNLGGSSNAYTSEESTAFYGKVLPELQEPMIDLLSDILRPALRKDDFDMEKKVVQEEIRMYGDQPPFLLDERRREVFWAGHPLARSVLGTIDSVGALTVEQMREYFERRYSPANIVFVATGILDFDRIVKWVDEHCGKWKPFEAPRVSLRAKGQACVDVAYKESAVQEYVFQLTDAPAGSDVDADRYAAALAAYILGGGRGSRFYWDLVDPGLAESASLSYSEFSDAGAFDLFLSCDPEDCDDNLERMRNILRDAQQNGFNEPEVRRAKNKTLTTVTLSGEDSTSRLFSIGEEWLLNRRYCSVAEELKMIREMTVDDLNAIIKRYPFDNPTTVAIGKLRSLRDY